VDVNEKHLPSFVLRSKYRREVFFKLVEKPYQTQSQLLKETCATYRSHLSKTFKELLDEGLIECENPKEKTFKIYKVTNKSIKVKEEIDKYQTI